MKDQTKSGHEKTPVSRRNFIKTSTLAAGAGLTIVPWVQSFAAGEPGNPTATRPSPAASDVTLNLLDGNALAFDTGVSFGVPWPQGSVKRGADFSLAAEGKRLPIQSWPLAYWPDGSIKWMGFATVVPAGVKDGFILSPAPSSVSGDLKVTHDHSTVVIDTGPLNCVIPVSGLNIISSMSIGGQKIVSECQLTCILQTGPQTEHEDSPPREKFISNFHEVAIEQSGPVRAVVKIEGMHRGLKSGREWLPFTVRLYFYTGQTTVRVVHSITFDGDQERDFLRGLGLHFGVPLREEPRNRTVRFAGADGGVWSEPLQPGGGNPAQENGQSYAGNPVFAANAIWDDFKLSQPTPDGFTIVKRTNPKSTWINSVAGKRSAGLAFVGDLGGGLAVSVKNFWQSYPAELQITNASKPVANLTAWLWSPDGPQMDMRHYDLVAHTLAASYEDVQPGMSTAYSGSGTAICGPAMVTSSASPRPTHATRAKHVFTA